MRVDVLHRDALAPDAAGAGPRDHRIDRYHRGRPAGWSWRADRGGFLILEAHRDGDIDPALEVVKNAVAAAEEMKVVPPRQRIALLKVAGDYSAGSSTSRARWSRRAPTCRFTWARCRSP